MDIFNNKLKIIMMIIILLLNSCKFKDEALGSEHGKGDAIKKQDAMKKLEENEKLDGKNEKLGENKKPKDPKTPVQILLDGFNFSDEYKEFVLYVQKALTNPNVGAPDNKTYTETEFYDLLVSLGKDRIENIAKGMSETLRMRKGIVDTIEALKDQAKKDKFNTDLAAADKRYFGFLKYLGSENTVDLVYGGLGNHNGDSLFKIIKINAPDVFQNGVQQRVP
ncbi:hypothetical protein BHO_0020000 (plasmid) [Borrelia hermsii YBT]|uniref:BTA121 domain-containing protein surface lipoprotein n=1 Tax=Borrelia hermsii TaxID=140 RepID=UPI0003E3460B|nr:hypothetical protein [Borrelia hermsii]AHH12964.1 hypothetical protein BHO_0020000 [Borrelia hermsii YBT]